MYMSEKEMIPYIDPRELELPYTDDSSLEEDFLDEEDYDDDKYDALYDELDEIISKETIDD